MRNAPMASTAWVVALALAGCGGGRAAPGTGTPSSGGAVDPAGLDAAARAELCRSRGGPQPAVESCPLDPANSFNGMPMDAPTRIGSLFERGMPELRCCWAGHDSRGQEAPILILYEVGDEQPAVLMPSLAAPPDVVECLTRLVDMWTFPPFCAAPDETTPAGTPAVQLMFPIRF